MRVSEKCLAATCFCLPSLAFSEESILESSLRRAYSPAVVKIVASGDADGRNACRNTGTGFFVGPKHLVTAAHVLKVIDGDKCGTLSYRAVWDDGRYHVFLKIVDQAPEDVALLELENDLPVGKQESCSLVLSAGDFTQASGWRISARAELPEVNQVSVQSYAKGNAFVRITGAPIWEGDSGGPVLVASNVAGLVHERELDAAGNGSMVKSAYIIKILNKWNIHPSRNHACNLAFVNAGPDYASVSVPNGAADAGLVRELNAAAMRLSLPKGVDIKYASEANPEITLKANSGLVDAKSIEASANKLKDAYSGRIISEAMRSLPKVKIKF